MKRQRRTEIERDLQRVTAAPAAERDISLSFFKSAALMAVITLLLTVGSALGTQRGWWAYPAGIGILRWGAYCGIGTALVSLVSTALSFSANRRRLVISVVCLAVGIVTVYLPWSWRRDANALPPIHDITTDTENPPRFVSVLKFRSVDDNSAEYEGVEVAAAQRAAYPYVKPVYLKMERSAAFEKAVKAVLDKRWALIEVSPDEGRIEATARTRWFHLKEDIAIRVTFDDTTGNSRVDVRSASRAGKSDIGTNARRIRDFIELLNK